MCNTNQLLDNYITSAHVDVFDFTLNWYTIGMICLNIKSHVVHAAEHKGLHVVELWWQWEIESLVPSVLILLVHTVDHIAAVFTQQV